MADALSGASDPTPLRIPITKAGRGEVLEVSPKTVDKLLDNPDTLRRVVEEGLKVILNSRATKIKQSADSLAKDGAKPEQIAEVKKLAFEQAEKNLVDLIEGKLQKRGTATKSDVPRNVMTEAVRQAREVVRDRIKAAGGKLYLYKASDITKFATQLVKDDTSYIEKAKAALAEREKIPVVSDILSFIKVDPELVAKAEAKNAEKKKTLSAKQAGKTKAHVPPSKPKPAQQATAH